MCMSVSLNAYLYAICVLRAQGQKRVLDPLVLELQMVVSHTVDAESLHQVLHKSSKYS